MWDFIPSFQTNWRRVYGLCRRPLKKCKRKDLRWIFQTQSNLTTKLLTYYANNQRKREKDSNFELFDVVHLNEVFRTLLYKCLETWPREVQNNFSWNIRHSLNRFLRSPLHNKCFDIVKDADFQNACYDGKIEKRRIRYHYTTSRYCRSRS